MDSLITILVIAWFITGIFALLMTLNYSKTKNENQKKISNVLIGIDTGLGIFILLLAIR
jgi:hypothetical protein